MSDCCCVIIDLFVDVFVAEETMPGAAPPQTQWSVIKQFQPSDGIVVK